MIVGAGKGRKRGVRWKEWVFVFPFQFGVGEGRCPWTGHAGTGKRAALVVAVVNVERTWEEAVTTRLGDYGGCRGCRHRDI